MDRSISRSTRSSSFGFRRLVFVVGVALVAASTTALAAPEPCGTKTYPFPYLDVASVTDPFCPGIMEAYVTGVTNGTGPNTFSPNETVTRQQMTKFLKSSLDQGLARKSRRGALNQWWITQYVASLQTIAVAGNPIFCAADGENIWVSTYGTVAQVQASTGKILGTWTGATNSFGLVVAAGKVFVEAASTPGSLYVIDPTLSPGPVAKSPNALGNQPKGIAFDGVNLWTANNDGSVSIISPQFPYEATTVSTGFILAGILYDGSNIWVTDYAAGSLLKLNNAGAIVQTVSVGAGPQYPVFDGANIWVPNQNDNSLTVVQASTGKIVATISADATNLLNQPLAASFDGDRVLVTNLAGGTVTVFRAADLSFITNVSTGASTSPFSACSDGINFWVSDQSAGLLRF